VANIIKTTTETCYVACKLPRPIFVELIRQVGSEGRALREVRYRWETLVTQLLRELAERNLSSSTGTSDHADREP
jgi:hypothetical protein